MIRPLFALATLGALVACEGGEATDSSACDRDPPLSYDNFGRGFLEKQCTGCHSSLLRAEQRNDAAVGIDLNSYRDALMWAERIQARVLDPEVPTMPPGGGPSADELILLDEWLQCELLPAAVAWREEGSP